ncbi:MAG: oligosaccharide flippase family protein, partial [Thermoproteota archaeon]
GYGLNGIVVGWIVGDFISFLMLGVTTSRLVKLSGSTLRNPTKNLPELLKFSWPIYASSITSFLYTWYDRALVLAYLPLTALGAYNVAYTAFSVLASLASSLGSALFPYYGMAYGRKNHNAISLGIKKASRYTMLILFPLIVGLVVTSKPVIALFAGQEYERGWIVLAILSSFGLVYGISPAFSNLLLIYGKTKVILFLNLFSIVVSLLFLPLVWFLSLAGLAIVRGTANLLTFLLSLYFLSKNVKIEIDYKVGLKAIFASIVMGFVVVVTQQVAYSRFLLPLYVALGGVAYVATIRALRVLNGEDFQLLQQLVGEKLASYATRFLGFSEDVIKS